VDFFDGETLIASDVTAPFTASWTTTQTLDGPHGLRAVAWDAAGNSGSSGVVDVIVDNTGPTTAIATPAPGAVVRGLVPATVSASDSSGVARVDLLRDGVVVATDAVAPYELVWDASGVPDGDYTLTAVAQDVLGNTASSAPVTITVDQSGPTVAIISPVSGATVKLTITVSASASDPHGVNRVELYDGASLIGTDTTAPYSVSWNTRGTSKGSHTLTARAYDSLGNVPGQRARFGRRPGDGEVANCARAVSGARTRSA
jgi:hypothetical protein